MKRRQTGSLRLFFYYNMFTAKFNKTRENLTGILCKKAGSALGQNRQSLRVHFIIQIGIIVQIIIIARREIMVAHNFT